MPKSAAVLIALAAVCLLAWMGFGLVFLGHAQGWQLAAGSLLGGIGAGLLSAGIVVARRGKRARS